MSASRTLLRRNKHYGETVNEEGEFVARPKRTKPGTPNRRILSERDIFRDTPDGPHKYEASFHATKGPRVQRVPL